MRDCIIACIHSSPGIHFRELLRQTDTAIGQLDYHLNSLLKQKAIRSFPDARYLRYFDADFDSQKMQLYSMMWNDAIRHIFIALMVSPQTQSQIGAILLRSPSTVSWYLQRLRTEKMVILRQGKYHLALSPMIVQECLGCGQSSMDKVLSRFSEGWNG